MSGAHRLVLFDIDGTILHGGRLWFECFLGAMQSAFEGTQFKRISFSGKTDRQICRELMEAAAVAPLDPVERDARIHAVISDYLARVREGVALRGGEVKLLPGVLELVDALSAMPGVVLALLTGNVREGAFLKLGAVGLGERFAMGVYGDDHADRYELPAIAADRAHRELGRPYRGKEIVIIGDTVHDVGCGRAVGARSIAVGTGQPDQRALILEARPDFFFEDLSDTAAVVRAIVQEMGSCDD